MYIDLHRFYEVCVVNMYILLQELNPGRGWLRQDVEGWPAELSGKSWKTNELKQINKKRISMENGQMG